MAKTYKPGESAPISGEYEIIGPRGGDTGQERTAVRGKPLPQPPRLARAASFTAPPTTVQESESNVATPRLVHAVSVTASKPSCHNRGTSGRPALFVGDLRTAPG